MSCIYQYLFISESALNLVTDEDKDEVVLMRYMAKVIQNLHYKASITVKRTMYCGSGSNEGAHAVADNFMSYC